MACSTLHFFFLHDSQEPPWFSAIFCTGIGSFGEQQDCLQTPILAMQGFSQPGVASAFGYVQWLGESFFQTLRLKCGGVLRGHLEGKLRRNVDYVISIDAREMGGKWWISTSGKLLTETHCGYSAAMRTVLFSFWRTIDVVTWYICTGNLRQYLHTTYRIN